MTYVVAKSPICMRVKNYERLLVPLKDRMCTERYIARRTLQPHPSCKSLHQSTKHKGQAQRDAHVHSDLNHCTFESMSEIMTILVLNTSLIKCVNRSKFMSGPVNMMLCMYRARRRADSLGGIGAHK